SYVKWEMHPPFHYYFLHFWFVLFGATETAAHLSSVFLSVGAVVALYFLGKELFNSRLAGLAAAALYSFSPLFCFFGVWARMYTMLFFVATLSFLFFLKFIKVRGRKSFYLGAFFIFFTLAALFTHLTAGLIVGIEVVYLIYLCLTKQEKLKEIFFKFLAPFLIIIAAYGPWFWYFWHSRFKALGGNAWYFDIHERLSPWVSLIYDSLKYLTPFDQYFFNLLAFSLLMILGFSAFAALSWSNKAGLKLRGYFSNGAFFSLLIFLLSFAGLSLANLYVLRYAIIPAIGLFLLLGYGFSRSGRALQAAAFSLFLTLSLLSFSTMSKTSLYPVDWKGAAHFIEQNEKSGDKIIGSMYTNIFSLDFYYHGRLPISAPLDEKYRGDDLLLTAIKTNIYPTTSQDNIGQMRDFLGNTRRIFFIISNGDGAFPGTERIAADWLAEQGFVKVQEWRGAKDNIFLVWIMERMNGK
ncbi:MAG TPA: glycosyltransferase family 39 protein, partial [Candidatus Nanoarchaeia archaeon]|nr:glycosyltransferase family 39 protein [Candidatus Nanoarchaeia archaeon]